MALADYIAMKPTLETERLILRQLIPDDIPALKEWMADKAMYRYWGKPAGRTYKNPELLFEKCGFTREGLIRQGKVVNTWCDYYIYGLLKTDIIV